MDRKLEKEGMESRDKEKDGRKKEGTKGIRMTEGAAGESNKEEPEIEEEEKKEEDPKKESKEE